MILILFSFLVVSAQRKHDIKGAVRAVVDTVTFFADVTQNVPYLGTISSALTELMMICDVGVDRSCNMTLLTAEQEVSECKQERKAVKEIVAEVLEIVDATQRQCDEHGNAPNVVPTALVRPMEKLQGYVRAPADSR